MSHDTMTLDHLTPEEQLEFGRLTASGDMRSALEIVKKRADELAAVVITSGTLGEQMRAIKAELEELLALRMAMMSAQAADVYQAALDGELYDKDRDRIQHLVAADIIKQVMPKKRPPLAEAAEDGGALLKKALAGSTDPAHAAQKADRLRALLDELDDMTKGVIDG